jgi:hypothetical protein
LRRLGEKSWFEKLSPNEIGAIGGIAALIVVITGVVYFVANEGGDGVDVATLCPTAGATGHTMVILDRTDPFTPSQVRGVKNRVDEIKAAAEPGDKISIFEVDPKKMNGLSTPIFSMCKPRAGSDADPIFENPRFLQETFKKKFGKPLEDALQQKLQGGGASHSPIIESIVDAVTLKDFGNGQPKRRLVIFSDLLQHGRHLSFFNKAPDFKVWSSTALGKNLIADLQSVDIEVFLLVRTIQPASRLQNAKMVSFWESYFQRTGVRNLTFRKIR